MRRAVIKLSILAVLLILIGSCLVGRDTRPIAPLCPAGTGLLIEVRDPLGTLELLGSSRFFEALAASGAAGPRTERFQQNLISQRQALRLLSAVVRRVDLAVIWDDPRIVYPFELGPPVLAFLDIGALRLPVKFILTAMSKGGKVFGVDVRGHHVFNAQGVSVAFVEDRLVLGTPPRINALLDVYDGMQPGLADVHPNWADLAAWADRQAEATGYLLDARLLRLKPEALSGLPLSVVDLIDLSALDGAVFNALLNDDGPLIRATIRQREGRSVLRLLAASQGELKALQYLSDETYSAVLLRLANPTELAGLLMELLRGGGLAPGAEVDTELTRGEAIRQSLLQTAITGMLAQVDQEVAAFSLEPDGPRVLFVLLKEVEAAQTLLRVLARAAGAEEFSVPEDGETGSLRVGESELNILVRGRKVLISSDAEALRRVDAGREPRQLSAEIGAAFEQVDPQGSLLLLLDLRRKLEAAGKLEGPDRALLLDAWRGRLAAGFNVQPDRTEITAYLPVDMLLAGAPSWWQRQTLTWLHALHFALTVLGWLLALLLLLLIVRQVKRIRQLRAEPDQRST